MRFRIKAESRRDGDIDWRPHAAHCKHQSAFLSENEKAVWSSLPASDKAAEMLTLLEGDVWTPSSAQLLEMRKPKLIEKLPGASEDEINDKGHSDILLKLLSVVLADSLMQAIRWP